MFLSLDLVKSFDWPLTIKIFVVFIRPNFEEKKSDLKRSPYVSHEENNNIILLSMGLNHRLCNVYCMLHLVVRWSIVELLVQDDRPGHYNHRGKGTNNYSCNKKRKIVFFSPKLANIRAHTRNICARMINWLYGFFIFKFCFNIMLSNTHWTQ